MKSPSLDPRQDNANISMLTQIHARTNDNLIIFLENYIGSLDNKEKKVILTREHLKVSGNIKANA